jgi:two-component system repressor protein LuxO
MPHGQAAAAPQIPVMRDLVLPMWRQEQRIIEDAIQSFAGNIALAAAALELSPSTIYRKRQAWAEMELKRA